MISSMQKNWVVFIRAGTVAAIVMAILFSALAMSPNIDHRDLPAQPSFALVAAAGVGVAFDGAVQPAERGVQPADAFQ